VRRKNDHQGILWAALGYLGQMFGQQPSGGCGELLALVIADDSRHAAEKYAVRAQRSRVRDEFRQRLIDQALQGRLDAGGTQVSAQFGAGQERKGQWVPGPAREQAQKMGRFGDALETQSVKRQLPGTTDQVARFAPYSGGGPLFNKVNGVDRTAV
jgi:hypothetical protein